MSKHKKKELLNALKSIHTAHENISKLMESHNEEDVKLILIHCQECAIQIGNEIETTEGEGSKTVSLLEEYCEMLYQISISLNKEKDHYKTYQLLETKVFEIENSFRDEFDMDRIEIAFFPYMASMWDSLESIWLAASEDPQCDCYVVPIPYYHKNPDGTFRQMNYEGSDFPDYVPITHWEGYNPQIRKPDLVYIHNPYDNGNHATSVHPDYYAKFLKDNTDILVYVPYFVVNDDVPEHHCINAGTIYADRVIVQSDKVKNTYINVLEKWIEENDFQSLFSNIKEKFLALGSPKFDKVINTMREEVIVPNEWEKLISREDGSRKKVVLYNTTIKAFLEHGEQMIRKLESVFQVFEKNDEFVLLWRPHPLMESTIASMRPQLLQRYTQLVKSYLVNGRGIYDDTPALHRAIALSDAYYGDGSSLVALYRITGKPIMIQNLGGN